MLVKYVVLTLTCLVLVFTIFNEDAVLKLKPIFDKALNLIVKPCSNPFIEATST